MNIDPEIAHKLDGVAAQESTLQSYEANEYIFRAGEPNTGCYRLCSGATTIALPAGEDEISAIDLLPGYWFGQSPSEKEATFFFGVRCTAQCSVERLSWRVLKQTEAANRSATNFFDALNHHVRTIQILIQTFRKTYPEISVEFLEDLIRSANFMHLDENQLLYEQGNCAQVMYFLLSGKIDVYVGAGKDLNRVGEIYHGEPFGEMSLFSNEKRNATLVATRNSELISLNRSNFDRLSVKYPWLSSYIVTSLINRVKKQNAHQQKAHHPVNRLILNCAGAYGTSAISPVLDQLENLVTRQHTEQHFAHANLADIPHTQMSDFLESIEQQHPRNVYTAESEDMVWSKICLERADDTWLVVDANDAVARVEQTQESFKQLFSWQRQRKNLILIHPDQNRIRNTEQWLRAIQPNRLCHLHTDSPRAARRLSRALSDQSVGLVLGGGGARGFAQIGILRAFEEANIEVDMIGGTSIGSIIGGWIAQGLDSQQITEAVERFFVAVNPLGDYTLPMISLSKSQRLDTLLEQAFGDQLIEDLPIPYFCISSDMSMAEERHHFQGCLRRAIRASISIPGVIAPVIEDGHYLVDGGLFNNLPCDLMRLQNSGPIIAIDVSPDDEYLTQLQSIPSPWELVANKLLNRDQPKVPSILETLLRSSTLVSTNRRRANRDIVDFYIQPDIKNIGMLDFKQAKKIIEAGYAAGQKALEEGVASIRKMRPPF